MTTTTEERIEKIVRKALGCAAPRRIIVSRENKAGTDYRWAIRLGGEYARPMRFCRVADVRRWAACRAAGEEYYDE